MYLLPEGPGLEVSFKSVFEPNHVFVKLDTASCGPLSGRGRKPLCLA